MTELLVRSPLPDLREPVLPQKLYDFARLEDRNGPHASGNLDFSDADELRLQFRLTVLQEHFQNLAEVFLNLIDVRALGMSTRPTRHVADQKTGVGISLDYNIVGPHDLFPFATRQGSIMASPEIGRYALICE